MYHFFLSHNKHLSSFCDLQSVLNDKYKKCEGVYTGFTNISLKRTRETVTKRALDSSHMYRLINKLLQLKENILLGEIWLRYTCILKFTVFFLDSVNLHFIESMLPKHTQNFESYTKATLNIYNLRYS